MSGDKRSRVLVTAALALLVAVLFGVAYATAGQAAYAAIAVVWLVVSGLAFGRWRRAKPPA